MVEAVKPNLTTLADIGSYMKMIVEEPVRIDEDAAAILRETETQMVLRTLLQLIEEGKFSHEDFYSQVMTALRKITGARGKRLFMPVRAALTGTTRGPELDKIFVLLGEQSVKERLKKALNMQGNFSCPSFFLLIQIFSG
jgi:nondiscriminating glutamyl-tRNA synthetase